MKNTFAISRIFFPFLFVIAVFNISMRDVSCNSDAIKMHVIGVSKLATETPKVIVEKDGEFFSLKPLFPVLESDLSTSYGNNIIEIACINETMKLSGFELLRHERIDASDPNENCLVLYYKR